MTARTTTGTRDEAMRATATVRGSEVRVDSGSEVPEEPRAMVLPARLESVAVFYDGRCGMCCTFHEWVNRQEKLALMSFVPYQSADAERLFPGIGALEPEREMVVRDEGDGTVYRGAEAWVICLFALTEYRGWARRLSSPALLPLAKRTCALLARNRHRLSRIFFRRKDREVAALLHRMPPPRESCDQGGCRA